MTDRPCPLCRAALAPGAVICGGCHAANRGRLRDVPGLLTELDVTAVGLGSTWREPSGDGGTPEPGLVMNERAHEAALALRTVLHGWARVWREETSVPPERERAVGLLMTTPAGQAALLAGQQLGSRPWAAEFADELADAMRDGWRSVDRPPDQVLIGRCPDCEASLYAIVDALAVRCRHCGAQHDAIGMRVANLAKVTTPLPAVDLAILLRIQPDRVYQWKRRGRIAAVGVNGKGQPLYRVADGQALLMQGEPQEEEISGADREAGDDGEDPDREAAAGVHAP